jgi:hypothetical protein
VPPQAYGYHSQ